MNTPFKKLIFAFLIALLPAAVVFGQGKITYRDLAAGAGGQNTYFDTIVLPGSSGEKVNFVTLFRFNYTTLPFKKNRDAGPGGKGSFYSTASLSLEVFKGKEANRGKSDNISVEGLESVSRAFWKDTAYAISYQQTQSNHTFMGGNLPVELDPGYYHYILQLTRGEDARELTSRTQSIDIKAFNRRKTGTFILADSVHTVNGGQELSILNFGGNVYYGKDFYALVHIPGYDDSSEYSLSISRIDIAREDTTTRDRIYTGTIPREKLHSGYKPALKSNRSNPTLIFDHTGSGLTFALVKIPNSTFPNAIFRMSVNANGREQPVAQAVFRSKWIDMPTSLLNLNVAIDMLRFIADRSTIRELSRGSDVEQEQKFRKFWKEKDPTPGTEFNELMAEYYRRIDYAYNQFTTINTVGYESDRGKIYIKYGAPDNIERKFPPGQATLEIWSYGSKQFTFRAVTGFGDFTLVSGE